jgi:ferredoxin
VDAAPVALDQDTCVRCGLCLNLCPTGVFPQTDLPESRLIQAIAPSPDQLIELACPRKEPADLSRVPGASVIRTPRCLAALSVPALLELATTGKTLWLNDSICAVCPIGRVHGAIQGAVNAANRWLQGMGHAPALRSYLTAGEELVGEAVSRPVMRGDRPIMSRRDFFRSLTRTTGQATASMVAGSGIVFPDESSSAHAREPGSSDDGGSWEGAGHRLPHRIPPQRQHLALVLRRLEPDPLASVPTAGLPIADVSVTEACTACGLCAQFCPTEALSFVNDEAYYVLNFSAALCLGEDCGLCAIGCPTQAVRFGKEVVAEELLSTQPRPIKAGRLSPCAQCGALTDAPDEVEEPPQAPLCYVCQARAHRPKIY